jgi:hypothetical protein
MDLDAEIDRLYGLTPTAFVPARDALAKRAKAELGKEAADEVKALRRPVAAIWAVNQLWHRDPKRFRRLLEMGDRVRAVQATRGRSAESLGEALSEQRELVRSLLDEAASVLEGAGLGVDANLERVRANLAALSAWGTDLPHRPGRLDGDVEPPGFEALLRVAPAKPRLRLVEPEPEPTRRRPQPQPQPQPEPQPAPKRQKPPPKPKGPTKAQREAHAAAKRALSQRQRDLDRATKQAESARSRFEEARGATARAREALARAQTAENEHRDALREAEAAREQAASALREAETAERDAAAGLRG